MKVLIACLVYGERPLDIIHKNLENSGYDNAEAVLINKEGIASAINYAIDGMMNGGYDALFTMANDIEEPDGWLYKRVMYAKIIPNHGLIGVPLEVKKANNEISGLGLAVEDVIGNMFLTRDVIEKIGYINPFGGERYAPFDNDYNRRCQIAGLINFYIPHIQAIHAGAGSPDDIYGYSKKEAIERTWQQHVIDAKEYESGAKPYTIYQKEWL